MLASSPLTAAVPFGYSSPLAGVSMQTLAYGMPVDRTSYMPGPFDTPAPPTGAQTAQEVAYVQAAQAHRTPQGDMYAAMLQQHGSKDIWHEFMQQYRANAGFVRGWLATGMLDGVEAVTGVKNWLVKHHFSRPRPYQVDPAIQPVGNAATGSSYVSTNASQAFAASTFMSALWPGRAAEFNYWAQQTALAGVYSGNNYPSDAIAGAALGRQTGSAFASLVS